MILGGCKRKIKRYTNIDETTLYLDNNLQIRGRQVLKLQDDDIFSKDQVLKITKQLMDEIFHLQNDNDQLRNELKKLNQQITSEIH